MRHAIEGLPPGPVTARDTADLCAAFQHAVGETVGDRVANAMDAFADLHGSPGTLVVAGGVAANAHLRATLGALAEARGFGFIAPPLKLCTDNGAMIAWAGIERLRLGLVDGLDFAPRPRWPLDPDAPTAAFAGAKA